MSPVQPLTLWVLITALATALIVGTPLTISLLSYRRASKTQQDKDITTLVTPIIVATVKEHNEELYAHPAALSRYTTSDTFNSSLRELRGEIDSLRTLISVNEVHRREDVQQFRDDFKDLK